ncbi:hypothetical protein BUALT_Bualt09G0115200 [Buddleja alternifolia]|uniref:Cyclin-like domain-containing protein n=1 Tax=Buddleja alternifolia TaxID=168488 RepID=A0AAV6X3G6_9LAMI|nr:hypothetical protein BUALT_Bualt09G0115200 [Buddleja alternifolia]
MESLLCNEVWLMSPNAALNAHENVGGCNGRGHVDSSSLFSTKEDREEVFGIFLDKEASYMPELGYLKLLNSNNFIHNARSKGVYWLIKSQRRMNLSPGTAFIAVNYLDRFISMTKCQGWKYWMFELLCIACLSVASKFNETTTRSLHEFQEEGLDHSFSSSSIQRMELTLLKELRWRMDSTTPFSYIHLLIQTIDHAINKTLVQDFTNRIIELLLNATLDTKFLEFQPSVITMSAIRCIFEDLFRSTNNVSLSHLDTLIPQNQEDDLMKCEKMMGKLLVQDHNMLACGNCWDDPSSPVTVLKVERKVL